MPRMLGWLTSMHTCMYCKRREVVFDRSSAMPRHRDEKTNPMAQKLGVKGLPQGKFPGKKSAEVVEEHSLGVLDVTVPAAILMHSFGQRRLTRGRTTAVVIVSSSLRHAALTTIKPTWPNKLISLDT